MVVQDALLESIEALTDAFSDGLGCVHVMLNGVETRCVTDRGSSSRHRAAVASCTDTIQVDRCTVRS